MHGKNEVAGPMMRSGGSLLVHSIFYTIQGEGPDAGIPAVFIRLAKCNLRCHFCDTEFETGTVMTVEQIWAEFEAKASRACELVVITGGEPLLQNIVPLTKILNSKDVAVAVETAGTVYYPELEEVFDGATMNRIIVSPKTPKLNEDLVKLADAFKYIIRAGCNDELDGLPNMSTQAPVQVQKLYRQNGLWPVPVYVQPMDEGDPILTARNMKASAEIAMKHGYRLSVQTHKVVGLE